MDFIKDFFNFFADPRVFFTLTLSLLILLVWKREAFASTRIGWGLQIFLAIFFGFGLFDENFRLIIGKRFKIRKDSFRVHHSMIKSKIGTS